MLNDNPLKKMIKSKLKLMPEIEGEPVAVATKGGMVTWGGSVKSYSEKKIH